jgi:hypothetical protein
MKKYCIFLEDKDGTDVVCTEGKLNSLDEAKERVKGWESIYNGNIGLYHIYELIEVQ